MFTRERIRFPCCLLYNFGCIIGIVQGGLQRCRRCNPPSPPVLLTPAVTKTIIPPNFALGGIFFSRGKLSQTHRGFAINGAKGVNRFAPGFQDVHVPVRRVKAKPLRGACAALTRLPRPPSRHRPFWGPLVRSAGRSRVLVGSPRPRSVWGLYSIRWGLYSIRWSSTAAAFTRTAGATSALPAISARASRAVPTAWDNWDNRA